MISDLIFMFDRDITRLKQEIEGFYHEDNLWLTVGSTKNSAGNLCLHLVGNLKTYIGKNIGNHPYVRNRDAEFSSKGVPRQTLVQQVEETKSIVIATLQGLDAAKLEALHVEEALGYKMTNRFFLIQLSAHLSYHLGQINYLRRVLE
jgi:hypothetical protein